MRRRALEIYAVLAAILMVSSVFARHRYSYDPDSLEQTPWHSVAVETAFAPTALAALVIALCLWARKRAPRGLLAAVLGLVAGTTLLLGEMLPHLLASVQTNDSGGVATLAALAMVAGALVLFVAEPIAAVRARRAGFPVPEPDEPSGARLTVRVLLGGLLGALGFLLGILLLVERHVAHVSASDAGHREWFLGDTSGLALMAPILIVAAALRVRGGYPRGVFAGLVALAATIGLAVAWSVMHGWVTNSPETDGVLYTMFALAVLGPIIAIADAVLYARVTGPPGPELPSARVTRSKRP